MDYARDICRRLHEEHRATLELWGRLEQALARPADTTLQTLLARCAAAIGGELEHHFAFEEDELFPRLAAAGEADIAALLAEEHESIRAAAREFTALLADRADAADRERRLRALGLELAERLTAHVQKEEMALLPLLDDLIDAADDAALVMNYAGN